MVQHRKAGHPSIQTVKISVKTDKELNITRPSPIMRGGNDLMKKKRKTRSLKVYEVLQSFKPSPKSRPDGSPNYMKPTTSSDARRENSQVWQQSQTPEKNHNQTKPISSNNSPKKISKHGSDPSSSKLKPTRPLKRTSSLKPMRPSMKTSGVPLYPKPNINRSTCSSTLKDSKFPTYVALHPGGTESEGTSVFKVCPYTYCSLNGHHHDPLPPLKQFLSARRRLLRTQKSLKSKRPSSSNRPKYFGQKGKKGVDTGQRFLNEGLLDETGSIEPPQGLEELLKGPVEDVNDFFVEIYESPVPGHNSNYGSTTNEESHNFSKESALVTENELGRPNTSLETETKRENETQIEESYSEKGLEEIQIEELYSETSLDDSLHQNGDLYFIEDDSIPVTEYIKNNDEEKDHDFDGMPNYPLDWAEISSKGWEEIDPGEYSEQVSETNDESIPEGYAENMYDYLLEEFVSQVSTMDWEKQSNEELDHGTDSLTYSHNGADTAMFSLLPEKKEPTFSDEPIIEPDDLAKSSSAAPLQTEVHCLTDRDYDLSDDPISEPTDPAEISVPSFIDTETLHDKCTDDPKAYKIAGPTQIIDLPSSHYCKDALDGSEERIQVQPAEFEDLQSHEKIEVDEEPKGVNGDELEMDKDGDTEGYSIEEISPDMNEEEALTPEDLERGHGKIKVDEEPIGANGGKLEICEVGVIESFSTEDICLDMEEEEITTGKQLQIDNDLFGHPPCYSLQGNPEDKGAGQSRQDHIEHSNPMYESEASLVALAEEYGPDRTHLDMESHEYNATGDESKDVRCDVESIDVSVTNQDLNNEDISRAPPTEQSVEVHEEFHNHPSPSSTDETNPEDGYSSLQEYKKSERSKSPSFAQENPERDAKKQREEDETQPDYFEANAHREAEDEENATTTKTRIFAGELNHQKEKTNILGKKQDNTDTWDEERKFNPRRRADLLIEPDPEAEKVDLRHQEMDERKDAEEWMLDYALRQAVTRLAPVRPRRVSLLIEAFETVMPPKPKCEPRIHHGAPHFTHAPAMQACS
ncbi:uncharacterized protein LOC18439182 [Amborella trichopoda]|uniref:Calmodulin-binding domain-containing protein n=1 Tax=Amborella trichopoda TaxID=13333 RepID=W1PSH5_AMBTC|nr:uncharacterized protein LOC18439182 [Amborella trichopoda]XP_011625228.1 uncharacterized protein LOC18439182 [Amborella trichopoda]ERN10998.1 hypothetical protein AMTR_s00160p00081520 [Amborella trichopoda]|eukprot:XP_006849417.1 uncharacterized protein LOC18439182 [Amborella trichopoda]